MGDPKPVLPTVKETKEEEEDPPQEVSKHIVNIDLRDLSKPSVRFTDEDDTEEIETVNIVSDDSRVYIRTPLQSGILSSRVKENSQDVQRTRVQSLTSTAEDTTVSMDKSEGGEAADGLFASYTKPDTDEDKQTSSKTPTSKKKRPSAFKRAQLEAYLPRKNFFNSHDKALLEAGYSVGENDESKKKPDWKKIYRLPSYLAAEKAGTEGQPTAESEPLKEDELFPEPSEEEVLTSMQTQAKAKKAKSKKVSDDLYKPLLDYLRYVADNPHEYVSAAKYSVRNTDHLHPSPLVRRGRAFQRFQHGIMRDNIFMHALNWLKPRTIDSSSTPRQIKEKSTKKDTKVDATGDQVAAGEDGKTELERLKIKAEKWMKGLSTMEYLKAKEVALSEVGQEDVNFSSWWIAFRGCRYLRTPPAGQSGQLSLPVQ